MAFLDYTGLQTFLNKLKTLFAPQADPVFTGSISIGRRSNTTIGTNSVATGTSVVALGDNSHAEGSYTYAKGNASHAEGYYTIAVSPHSRVSGKYNYGSTDHYAESEFSAWTYSGTVSSGVYRYTASVGYKRYVIVDGIKKYYICNQTFTTVVTGEMQPEHYCYPSYPSSPYWTEVPSSNVEKPYAEIVGNGTGSNSRSNARALDWDGNEYLKGDIYIQCAADSTSGTKLIPIPSYDSTQDEGKFLRIVNGAPTWVTIPPLNGGVF